MSKFNKVLLVIGTVCVVLGIIASGTAFALARFNLEAFSTTGPYEQREYTAKSADIDTIEFSGALDDVYIQRGSVKTIEVEYWASKDYAYNIDESSRTLELDYDDRFRFGINFISPENHDIIITVPDSFTGTLDIDNASGIISVDTPSSLKGIEINTVSGNVDITCKDLGSLSVKGVSGRIDFSTGSIDRVQLDTVRGNTDFTAGPIGSLNFKSLSGSLKGKIADKSEDYRVTGDSLSGTFDVPGASSSGKNTLDFDTVSGSARIEFTE